MLAGGLEQVQLLEGPVIGAPERPFVADQQDEALAVVGEFLEGVGEAVVVAGLLAHLTEFVCDVFGAAHDFVVEESGFDGLQAAETPAGGGQGVNQLRLDAGSGSEVREVGIEEELVVFAGLGGEHDGCGRRAGGLGGGESVAGAVTGGLGAACGGDGSAGLSAVGAGGFGF